MLLNRLVAAVQAAAHESGGVEDEVAAVWALVALQRGCQVPRLGVLRAIGQPSHDVVCLVHQPAGDVTNRRAVAVGRGCRKGCRRLRCLGPSPAARHGTPSL
eukprot:2344435-Pyramimonas_sp.AAC.5